MYFEDGFHESPVYVLSSLKASHEICGPAIIIDRNNTIVVEPQCTAVVTLRGDLIIKVLLSVFSCIIRCVVTEKIVGYF